MYTEYVIENKKNKVMILTDIHYCHIGWYGMSTTDRMNVMTKAVNEYYEEAPYDVILCLGDYSLDFWQHQIKGSYLNTPSVSNTANFMKEVYPKFPVKAYMIPGNHEQYGNEKWKEITGFDRQFSVVYGDYVFLMLDTFGGNLDPAEHHDGVYTGIDVDFLEDALKKYSNKKIILCAHDLHTGFESEKAKKLVFENKNIMCVLAGHIHRANTVISDSEWRNIPIFYCGDFAYTGGEWGKEHLNWGFRILDFGDKFSTEYVTINK